MKISPINHSINSTYTKNHQKISAPNFKHHPDFIELKKKYEITASNYFRRGGFYGCTSEKFVDVINTLKLYFTKHMKNEVSMLIGGVAESQEPYSLLAVIKDLIGKTLLRSVLDLNTIDLQSKPDDKTIFLQSFYDGRWEPDYVPKSFVREESADYGYKYQHCYRVKPDIYKYLLLTYNNPEKARWETRLQEGIKDYPDKSFDIISINNTLGYIGDYKMIMNTVKEIQSKLKPGGVFITDPHITDYQEVFSPEVCDEIYQGIYRMNKDNIKKNAHNISSSESFSIKTSDETDCDIKM